MRAIVGATTLIILGLALYSQFSAPRANEPDMIELIKPAAQTSSLENISSVQTQKPALLDLRTCEPIPVNPENDKRYSETIREVIFHSKAFGGYALLIDKQSRTAYWINSGAVDTTFTIALGDNPVGEKIHEWDYRTPEGVYEINWVKDGSRGNRSNYGLALRINYPKEEDWKRFREARAKGLVPNGINNPGKDMEIHSTPIDSRDCTDCCIGILQEGMERIMSVIRAGNTVGIVGYTPELCDLLK